MITLFGKKGKVELDLPREWQVLRIIFKEPPPRRQTLRDLILEAIEKPIESKPFDDLIKPHHRVALVVDDLTRPTPLRELLPPLLERIDRKGIPAKQVDIIIATGTHRPMTKEEIQERLGDEIVATYRVENHDAWSPNLVKVGEIPGYGSVAIHPIVARADVRVTLGSLLPHLHNGFGGGPKSIMPGICNYETVLHHHLKNAVDHRSVIGNIKDNPFYNEVCQISRLTRVDFSMNCLFDSLGKVSAVLAGDPFALHEVGIRRLNEEVGVDVPEKADLTIVSSYPYDEGPQIVKPLLPAAMVTKPGGTIWLWSEIKAPLPETFLASISKIRGEGGDEAEACIKGKLCRLQPLIEEVRGVDFNLALLLIFFVCRKFRVVLAGRALKDAAEKMGFEFAPDLAGAIEAEKRRKRNPTVNIIPAGGYVFPIIEEPFHLVS